MHVRTAWIGPWITAACVRCENGSTRKKRAVGVIIFIEFGCGMEECAKISDRGKAERASLYFVQQMKRTVINSYVYKSPERRKKERKCLIMGERVVRIEICNNDCV